MLFNFVLVSAVGILLPPHSALSAGRPEQRRISFADSPRYPGPANEHPRAYGWTDILQAVPGNNSGMYPALSFGRCSGTMCLLSAW